MSFTVVIDGKPCAGKTTQASLVAQELRDRGVNAVNIKEYSRANALLRGIVDAAELTRQRSGKSSLELAISDALSFFAISASYLSNIRKNVDVLVMESTPYTYGYSVESADKDSHHSAYKLVRPVARLFNANIIVYLSADDGVLLSRFEHRDDHRDAMHKRQIFHDDSELKKALRDYVGDGRFIELDARGDKQSIAQHIVGKVIAEMGRAGRA
ncbi:MAG: hypothetical protein KGH57_03775 [Candidatus Micrarchaeota archaeon]|nr:hypothetical protein [Candidatus Micrarchaeota archaeon]